MSDQALEIMATLTLHEQEMASLYALFADTFPAHRAFWLAISQEEEQHHGWLLGLTKAMRKGELDTTTPAVQIADINASIATMRDSELRCLIGEMDILAAARLARDLEIRMIESRFFDLIAADGPGAEICRRLHRETTVHRARILDFLTRCTTGA